MFCPRCGARLIAAAVPESRRAVAWCLVCGHEPTEPPPVRVITPAERALFRGKGGKRPSERVPRRRPHQTVEIVCQLCGRAREVSISHKDQRYCGRECGNRARGNQAMREGVGADASC
jgi:hypothetical protein